MRLSEAAIAMQGELIGDDLEFNGVSTDTRSINSGDLFIALQGANFDGNRYAEDAIRKGAIAVVITDNSYALSAPRIRVENGTIALGQLAKFYRQQLRGKVIAVTGSCGKTSVKGMLASIFSRVASANVTQANFNNHIGVPLTLLKSRIDDGFVVIEAGTGAPGEIDYLTKLIDPDVALVINVYAAHYESFGSLSAVAKEKASIYTSGKRQVIPVVNFVMQKFSEIDEAAKSPGAVRFAINDQAADVVGLDVTFDDEGRASFSLFNGNECYPVNLSVPGEHQVENALAAAACAIALDVEFSEIARGLECFKGEPGRMEVYRFPNKRVVIDDSYNANPASMKAAIAHLKKQPNPILVLGDMAELGEITDSAHRDIGETARNAGIKVLLACGQNTEAYAQGFGSGIECFPNKKMLSARLNEIARNDCTVLIKGSRSSRMEDVLQKLDEEWGEN